MKILVFTIIVFCLSIISCYDQSITPDSVKSPVWEKVNNLPGSYIFQQIKGNNIYMVVGTADGYKFIVSKDSGKSWQENNLDFLVNSVGFLSVEGDVFFISGANGLYKSTDEGNTWHEDIVFRNYIDQDTLIIISNLSSIAVNGDEIYVGQLVSNNMSEHVKGILFSYDGGETWSCPNSVGTPTRVTAIKKMGPILFYSNFKLYYSNDNLISWNTASGINNGESEIVEFYQTDSRVFGVSYRGIKYSDFHGTTWSDCTPVLTSNQIIIPGTFVSVGDKIFIMDNKRIIHYSQKLNFNWKEFDSDLPAFDPFPYGNQSLFTLGDGYLYYISKDQLWKKKIAEQ